MFSPKVIKLIELYVIGFSFEKALQWLKFNSQQRTQNIQFKSKLTKTIFEQFVEDYFYRL